MFTPNTRFLILAFISVTSIIMAVQDKYIFLIAGSIISLFLLWDYVARSTVPLALRKIASNDYGGAEKVLGHIKNFERLNNTSQNQYIMLKGLIEHQKENFDEAVFWLEKGAAVILNNDNHKAMCLIALCDIALIRGNRTKAKNYLGEMDGLKVNKNISQTVAKLQGYIG